MAKSMALTAITGNTFPVKDLLRAMGGRWDGVAKAWMVPNDKVAEAQAIVAGAGAKTPRPAGSTYRPTRCKECGCGPSRYVKILRMGLCGPCYGDMKAEGGY